MITITVIYYILPSSTHNAASPHIDKYTTTMFLAGAGAGVVWMIVRVLESKSHNDDHQFYFHSTRSTHDGSIHNKVVSCGGSVPLTTTTWRQ